MATRSTIWVQNDDGSATGIYCHWDGYPSNNGSILLKYYNSLEKVKSLIALGGISVLDKHLAPPVPIEDFNRIKGYTLAYSRDRGEELMQLKADVPVPEVPQYTLFTGATHQFEEFNYIFKDNAWHLIIETSNGIKYKKLTKTMCK